MSSPSPVTEEETSILSLPNDFLFKCFARVSRLYYPTLSLVRKTFQSIVASSELYETRLRLNRTGKCLYLGMTFSFDLNTHWFTLYRKPNKNIADKSSGYHLDQVPSPNCLLLGGSSSVIARDVKRACPRPNGLSITAQLTPLLIADGSIIYKIGGAKSYRFKFGKRRHSSSVSVLDCRTHIWSSAPRMQLARSSSSTVSLVDGKIYVADRLKISSLSNSHAGENPRDVFLCTYTRCSLSVAGGFEDSNFSNWIEVYDPMTKSWGSVKNHCFMDIFDEYQIIIVVKTQKLRHMCRAIDSRSCITSSFCVVDNVLFIWDKEVFQWYDLRQINTIWCAKISVLWEECLPCQQQINTIWCAKISFEKRDGDEIWGKVEWFDDVLSVHSSGSLL
ncbi:PREDICTED: putative F-box/kelch-repeat protein At1g61540 [Camelina sativa]|uniref:F-box/kelch-repeat protein At1g61540 n=1 Tax=Camelina sativa TaxID=90675 RepID=A0ABM1QTL3_CAMSA|nr:PREDICTED: putative F-box/kelch-repeat protein At1g61540 [Camelina sativa]